MSWKEIYSPNKPFLLEYRFHLYKVKHFLIKWISLIYQQRLSTTKESVERNQNEEFLG